MAKKQEQPSIEDRLRRLEEITRQLEMGDKPLADQLAMFEEGMKLAQECRDYLSAAEVRIEKISASASSQSNTSSESDES
ncbi:MAG TPA: exodeoxyribonuclease VII small subunit [Bacteroidetes bacterium]|nr:exodeoxyribonuclease VII small subunit [Bacteroidota bacterium]HRK03800.1 exodeoxyribonuclease VII small subunit [Chlorobiota bacterium]